jgi:TetR/AcrR family transcriptional regulator, transcriptional repressor for nem operon
MPSSRYRRAASADIDAQSDHSWGELSDRDPRSRQAFAAAFERWHEAIRHGLERMRELGEVSAAADPDSLALAILAVLEGGLLFTQITRSLEQGLDSMIDLIASYRP